MIKLRNKFGHTIKEFQTRKELDDYMVEKNGFISEDGTAVFKSEIVVNVEYEIYEE